MKETRKPVNQERLYKKFSIGTQYPINASKIPKVSETIAAVLKPEL